jgi:hypothetical protein
MKNVIFGQKGGYYKKKYTFACVDLGVFASDHKKLSSYINASRCVTPCRHHITPTRLRARKKIPRGKPYYDLGYTT